MAGELTEERVREIVREELKAILRASKARVEAARAAREEKDEEPETPDKE
jgi:hypothetical protein